MCDVMFRIEHLHMVLCPEEKALCEKFYPGWQFCQARQIYVRRQISVGC